MTNLHCVRKRRQHLADRDPYSQSYGLSSSHVQLWELDHKEARAPKNWHFQTVVLEKTRESLLDSKEIKPVNLKGNQPWILIWRTDAKAEAPILRPPDVKSWLIGKDPDSGKDWRQEDKRGTEDKMARWHHWCNGHELGQTPGDGEGQVMNIQTQLCEWTTKFLPILFWYKWVSITWNYKCTLLDEY